MSGCEDQEYKQETEESGQNDSNENKGKWLHCLVPDCNKKFQSCWSLTRHTRTHTGEKPFRCSSEGCGKEFIEKCALRRHEQTHNNDKQFNCYYPHCGKKFKLKEYLDVHKRTHVKDPLDGDCQPCDLLDLSSTEGLSDAIIIEQLRDRLLRLSIRRNEDTAELKAENEQMKACLKECRFALEISLSLLQSSSSNAVPKALTEILNKITNANKYFNRDENLPCFSQEQKPRLPVTQQQPVSISSGISYDSSFDLPLGDTRIHSDVGNSRLRRFEYWEASAPPVESNNGITLFGNEEHSHIPSPKRMRVDHLEHEHHRQLTTGFCPPPTTTAVLAEVPVVPTDRTPSGSAMKCLAMTALSMFP